MRFLHVFRVSFDVVFWGTLQESWKDVGSTKGTELYTRITNAQNGVIQKQMNKCNTCWKVLVAHELKHHTSRSHNLSPSARGHYLDVFLVSRIWTTRPTRQQIGEDFGQPHRPPTPCAPAVCYRTVLPFVCSRFRLFDLKSSTFLESKRWCNAWGELIKGPKWICCFVSLMIFCEFCPIVFLSLFWVFLYFLEFLFSLFSAVVVCFLHFSCFVGFLQDLFILQRQLPCIRLRSNFDRFSSLITGVYATYVNFLPFLWLLVDVLRRPFILSWLDWLSCVDICIYNIEFQASSCCFCFLSFSCCCCECCPTPRPPLLPH